MIARPHDALFKLAFEAPAHAAMLLRALLPPEVTSAIAWRTLRRETGSLVDAALMDRHCDLLFSAQLRARRSGIIFLLLEHQSTDDFTMPLRTLSYQTRIWERIRKEQRIRKKHQIRKQQRTDLLPPIIAVVVNHVPGGWTTSRSLEDMLDPVALAIEPLAALVPRFSMLIADLAALSDDDIAAICLGGFQKLVLWLLRDARDPVRLLDSFDAWVTTMLDVERGPSGSEGLESLMKYMFRVVDPVHHDALHVKIRQLGSYAEETAMTIAEQLHKEGRKEGCLALLRHQLRFKFKQRTLGARYEARLRAASSTAIDRYSERVLIADSLAEVFED